MMPWIKYKMNFWTHSLNHRWSNWLDPTKLYQKVCNRLGCEIIQLGVVHKLRLQDEVGRWSKKSTFCQRLYHRKCQRMGVGGQKKPKSCQHSLCRTLIKAMFMMFGLESGRNLLAELFVLRGKIEINFHYKTKLKIVFFLFFSLILFHKIF